MKKITVALEDDTTARVLFDRPVRAVAPGQSCVFYDGETVLGGGILLRPADTTARRSA